MLTLTTTRFNPSLNGDLHLGHIYTVLVNRDMASKGYFILRFDDTSPHLVKGNKVGETYYFMERQLEDLEWLGIVPDRVSLQSDLIEKYKTEINFIIDTLTLRDTPAGQHILPKFVRFKDSFVAYPYVPEQTAERVVMDYYEDIRHLIRGEDFSTEYSLYRFFCDYMSYPHPKFTFLPRLNTPTGDISKTQKSKTVRQYREDGYTASKLLQKLRITCLIDLNRTWKIDNLINHPVILP